VGANAPQDRLLVTLMAIYTCQQVLGAALSAFNFGYGTVHVNTLAAVAGAAVNIPLCIVLASVPALGSAGVAVAGMISLLPSTVLLSWQLRLHFRGEASGIWAR
jgi:Na+-driven multidrug efflux pump